MFEGQPKGLYALALANTGERFGYYTMLAIFTLFLQAKFGFSAATTSTIFGGFLAAVYFMPLVGGVLADKFGYGKMVTSGIVIMFAGYVLLSIPTSAEAGKMMMFGALALIAVGTGLFKGTYTQHNLVPEAQNDMVFSVICEEFGFIGAVALLLIFVFLIVKILHVGRKSNNYAAQIMCSGIAFMLGSQIMVNIGMCTKLLPVIGITLPFISAGGSSSLCIYIAIGIILGIYRYSKIPEPGAFTYNKLSVGYRK